MGSYVQAEDWLASRTGYGRRTYRAYVPHMLNGWEPLLRVESVEALTRAAAHLRQIAAMPHTDIGAALADWMTARDESIRTSAIENVHTAGDALAWARYRAQAGQPVTDQNEALTLGASRQISAAVALGRQMAAGRRCTSGDVLRIHSELFRDTPDRDLGGVIRSEPIWIGPPDCLIDDATFVPPPPSHVAALVEDLVDYMNSDGHAAALQAAIVHAQFETIHPFDDGNGRTGRALIQTVLNARGPVSGPVPISTALERDRVGYYDALDASRVVCPADDAAARSEALATWMQAFSEACSEALSQASRTAAAVERLADRWQQSAKFRSDSAASALLSRLPALPILDTALAAEHLGVTRQVARDALRALADVGIVERVGGNRNIRYTVPEMVSVMRHMHPDGALRQGAAAGSRPITAREPGAVRPSAAVCGHRGSRTGKTCILPRGHRGQHRYRRAR